MLIPDFGKLNVPKLKQDFPKFSPWVAFESTTEWSSFLSSGLTGMIDAATAIESDLTIRSFAWSQTHTVTSEQYCRNAH